MPFLPTRRWFQIRLRTWFAIVGILSIGMTIWPWLSLTFHSSPTFDGRDAEEQLGFDTFTRSHNPPVVHYNKYWIEIGRNPQLALAVVALAAFLAWNLARIVGRRIAVRRVAPGAATTATPARRWFQFRLRTWFAIVAILAVWLSARPSLSCHTRKVRIAANLEKPAETLLNVFARAQDPSRDRQVGFQVRVPPANAGKGIGIGGLMLLAGTGAWIIGPRIVRRLYRPAI